MLQPERNIMVGQRIFTEQTRPLSEKTDLVWTLYVRSRASIETTVYEALIYVLYVVNKSHDARALMLRVKTAIISLASTGGCVRMHAKMLTSVTCRLKLNMAEPCKKVKRNIPLTTFNKWQIQFDREFSSLSWLQCDKDSTDSFVETLWCVACRKFESSIEGMKNFWIVGSTN